MSRSITFELPICYKYSIEKVKRQHNSTSKGVNHHCNVATKGKENLVP